MKSRRYFLKYQNQGRKKFYKNAGLYIEYWHEKDLNILFETIEDEGIKYYCAGYIARALMRKEHCNDCKTMLIADLSAPNIVVAVTESELDEIMRCKKETFLQFINRGELCTPSDLVHLCCTHAFDFPTKLSNDEDLKSLILQFPLPRKVFVHSFLTLVEEKSCMVESILNAKCGRGHEFKPMFKDLVKRVFNICSKNLIAEANCRIHQARKLKNTPQRSATAKKITRLLYT